MMYIQITDCKWNPKKRILTCVPHISFWEYTCPDTITIVGEKYQIEFYFRGCVTSSIARYNTLSPVLQTGLTQDIEFRICHTRKIESCYHEEDYV